MRGCLFFLCFFPLWNVGRCPSPLQNNELIEFLCDLFLGFLVVWVLTELECVGSSVLQSRKPDTSVPLISETREQFVLLFPCLFDHLLIDNYPMRMLLSVIRVTLIILFFGELLNLPF